MSAKTAGRASPRAKRDGGRIPTSAHPVVRRALIVALSVGVLGGGARVWENQSRSQSLRTYLRRLERAEQPFLKHIDPSSAQSLLSATHDFDEAKIPTNVFLKVADIWEKDFRLAKDQVHALTPPPALHDAQIAMESGIESYVGVARLLNLAGQLRQVEARAKIADQQNIEDKVQVEIQQAQEEEARAENVYALGGSKLSLLKHDWLGIETPTMPGVPAGIVFSPRPTPSQ